MAIRFCALLALLQLSACGSLQLGGIATPPAAESAQATAAEDPAIKELRERVDRLSAHLVDANRRNGQLAEECRRTDAALRETLRESQKKIEELQQKLDALRAIDRDTRQKGKR